MLPCTAGKPYKRVKYIYDPFKSNDKTIRYYQSYGMYKSYDAMREPIIKIEHDLGRYNKKIDSKYIMYFRTNKNWRKCFKTGLVRFEKTWVFYGDIPEIMHIKNYDGTKELGNPRDFVLIQFSEDTANIVVDVFKNFYPIRKTLRNEFIKEHKFLYKKRDWQKSLKVV